MTFADRMAALIQWTNQHIFDHDHHLIPWAVVGLIGLAVMRGLEASVGHLCLLLAGILTIAWGGYHYQQGVRLKNGHGHPGDAPGGGPGSAPGRPEPRPADLID